MGNRGEICLVKSTSRRSTSASVIANAGPGTSSAAQKAANDVMFFMFFMIFILVAGHAVQIVWSNLLPKLPSGPSWGSTIVVPKVKVFFDWESLNAQRRYYDGTRFWQPMRADERPTEP